MTNWLPVIERMEEALARMLARAELPPADSAGPPSVAPPPSLDEVLAPAAERLAEAERQVLAADALLEEASRGLEAWRSGLAALRARLEAPAAGAVS